MLPEIKIASQCPVSWDSMSGDEVSRHCSQCNLRVYNFSEMTPAQIGRLISASDGGRLCGRLYRRSDGTMLTKDCPVGLRRRMARVSRRLTAALATAIGLACSVSARSQVPNEMMGDVAVAGSGFNLSVLSPDGKPVSQAQISIIDLATNRIILTGKTDDAGKFSRLSLKPANYTILVEHAALQSQYIPVSVRKGEMQKLKVKLQQVHVFMGIVAYPKPQNRSLEKQ